RTYNGRSIWVTVISRIHENEPAPAVTWKTRVKALYKRYHIKHLLPLMFIMIYMVLGSVIFYFLESSTDQDSKDEQYRTYVRERELLRRRMDEIFHDRAARRREVRLRFIDDVSNESQWTLMSAMYYSGTLFTTIGYGDIACVTVAGRILTVIYSCIGIPLMLITLNDCGKFLYSNINGCVKNVETFGTYLGVFRICGKTEPKTDEVLCFFLRSNEQSVPIQVALGITIGWIFFCSGLFRLWEDWTYAESCYFMYISLSTIGLGDIAVARRDMMVLCFVFVIVGLSLVSMSINVVQVALEDFYINLMMKLIIEYQQKMAAGGDHMGASVGMMRMWSGNKTAKYLMPLLSKEKKRVAMDKVAQEAQEKGIEVPTILNDLDEKTGIPKLFNIQESAEGEEAPIELEQMVQKQIMLEEAADVPIIIMHEAECQTDAVETLVHPMTLCKQTTETVVEEKKESQEEEVQTDVEEGHHAETQTIVVEMVDAEVVTVVSTLLVVLPTMDQISQTAQADLVDVEVATEIETKNIRVQTPCPVIEQKTIQTEDLEESRSTSKMSSARKRIRRAFAKQKPTRSLVDEKPTMSDWKVRVHLFLVFLCSLISQYFTSESLQSRNASDTSPELRLR
ncbi:unnamed protein product, partial [Heligmosomoides polygyrus]